MNFLVTNSVAVPINIILVLVLLFRAYPSVHGEVICHPTNERICHSRWWERHVATLRVSGTRMVAVRSDHHHRHPIAEYLAAQTELLRQLVQRQQQQQQQRGGPNVHQPQAAGYPEFLATQPPLFNKTEEPLDADAWIRTIESKFSLLLAPCSEQNKARFAAQ